MQWRKGGGVDGSSARADLSTLDPLRYARPDNVITRFYNIEAEVLYLQTRRRPWSSSVAGTFRNVNCSVLRSSEFFGRSVRAPSQSGLQDCVNANMSKAPKKKNNKKKKNKSKSNGDTTKAQDAGKDVLVDAGDAEAELDDSEQSAVVRMTPVQLPKYKDQHIILTAQLEHPERGTISRKARVADKRA